MATTNNNSVMYWIIIIFFFLLDSSRTATFKTAEKRVLNLQTSSLTLCFELRHTSSRFAGRPLLEVLKGKRSEEKACYSENPTVPTPGLCVAL